jgi:hypothetical protein
MTQHVTFIQDLNIKPTSYLGWHNSKDNINKIVEGNELNLLHRKTII